MTAPVIVQNYDVQNYVQNYDPRWTPQPWNFPIPANVQLFREKEISVMFAFLLWCILFVLCWPLALLALIAYPFIWLLLLPFRIVGVAVHGVLEVIFLAITLPFRLIAAPFRI